MTQYTFEMGFDVNSIESLTGCFALQWGMSDGQAVTSIFNTLQRGDTLIYRLFDISATPAFNPTFENVLLQYRSANLNARQQFSQPTIDFPSAWRLIEQENAVSPSFSTNDQPLPNWILISETNETSETQEFAMDNPGRYLLSGQAIVLNAGVAKTFVFDPEMIVGEDGGDSGGPDNDGETETTTRPEKAASTKPSRKAKKQSGKSST